MKVGRPRRIGGCLLSYGSLTRSIRPPRRMIPFLSCGVQGKNAPLLPLPGLPHEHLVGTRTRTYPMPRRVAICPEEPRLYASS